MKKICVSGLFWILLSSTSVTFAGVEDKLNGLSQDLDNFVQGIGYASNTTAPTAYQSQASGYFGGGSLYARNQVKQYQLMTLDMPDYHAGCSGIDLHMGGLSYISNEKLVDLGKAVMKSGGAYAVDVMLASTIPELKQVRDYLQSTVQKINQMSVNSCEAAQNLVGGVWPKVAASQQKICIDQRRMGKVGLAHDYVNARMECAGDGFKEGIQEAQKDPVSKKEVILDRNIVWSLIKDREFIANNRELAEMVMSLTGTYIIDANGVVKNVPSLASDANLIRTLLGANSETVTTAKIWACDDANQANSKCMNVSLKEISVSNENSLSGKIHKIIHEINTKLKSDAPMSVEEKNFLSMTPLPVLKFLMVLNSAHYGDAAVDMDEYATLIAQNLMQQYLNELLNGVLQATNGSTLTEDLLKDIEHRIHGAEKKIAAIEPMVGRKLTEKLNLINNIVRVEKQLATNMGGSLS